MTTKEQQSLLAAATAALHRGWHIFGSPCKTKATYEGSHGSKDALNDDRALLRWRTHPDSNPCVRLDRSGLTVLDADHGLTSLEHAEGWAKANGIPETYIVRSGRLGGGFHFYFKGVRTLPDVVRNTKVGRVGFELDGVSGDIKCHGHVVLEGGFHKTGAIYVGNGKHIAPLPEFLRDYQDPVSKRRKEHQEQLAAKRAAGQGDASPAFVLIDKGGRHRFLLSEAGKLRWQGLNEAAIYLGLKDICLRFCEDGANYSDADLQRLATDIGAKPCDRRLSKGKIVPAPGPTSRELISQLLRREFAMGCLVAFRTIVARIAADYPAAPKTTVLRAMKAANFTPAGKDPVDGRIQLWTRKGTKKRAAVAGGTP
jgi:hypothetical protein